MLTKDQAASQVAETHYLLESGISQIYRVRKEGAEEAVAEPIKLLEVNADTVPSGVTPVYFGPRADRGMPYPRVIIDLTPDEFSQVQSSELALPDGWRVCEPLPRPVAG